MTHISIPKVFKESAAEFNVPLELQDGFWNYFMYGWEPGSFGMAILRNDFFEAVSHAHPSIQAEGMRNIARWFYNVRLPRVAFGSDEKITAWRALSDEQRKEVMEDCGLCPTVFSILRKIPGPNA